MAESMLFDERDPKNQSIFSIQPKDLLEDNDSGFYMAIALICNDIEDVIFLHDLLEKDVESIHGAKHILPYRASLLGRRIYIIRHAASLMYSALEFIDKTRYEFSKIPKEKLGENAGKNLNFLLAAADEVFGRNKEISPEKNEKFTSIGKQLLKLLNNSRNQLTYHHTHSQKYLKEGLRVLCSGQISGEKEELFLYINQSHEYELRRNYYIDICVERYLTSSTGIVKNELGEFSDYILSFMDIANSVFHEILEGYYSRMKVPTLPTSSPPSIFS